MSLNVFPGKAVAEGPVFGIWRFLILALICILAFFSRLYSIIRFESIIHEFDPQFNMDATEYLTENGLYAFLNYFDPTTWYPLGRTVGGTIYPGLMCTAALIHKCLNLLHLTISIKDVCVFLAPAFSGLCALAAYHLTKEVKDEKAGLLAAAFIAICPGYISRSVAGSYDNEGVAIFAMVFVYYCWVKAVKTGSIKWGAITALVYFYMVAAWGGYKFITNIIPLHVALLVVMGRYSKRLYVAYCSWYVLATLLSMNVFFVNFNVVEQSDHLSTHGMFAFLQVYAALGAATSLLEKRHRRRLFGLGLSAFVACIGVVIFYFLSTGKIQAFSGRFYSMFDPTWASKYLPLIASVSEHQPTVWTSYVFDLHILIIATPVGLFHMFRDGSDASIFVAMYCLLSTYFSGVMVRLMLVLAPATCVAAAVGISVTLDRFAGNATEQQAALEATDKDALLNENQRVAAAAKAAAAAEAEAKAAATESPLAALKAQRKTSALPLDIRLSVTALVCLALVSYSVHCAWVTQAAYSSPSIVVQGGSGILDDYREAYDWLRRNTAEDASIMSWWDYGYQIHRFSNRTTMVDNNTWNNTHISQVGQAMSMREDESYKIVRRLDADYLLVIFGGLIGYSSDDINKMLWMIRIGGNTNPVVKEHEYYNSAGQFSIGADGSETLLNSVMYKLCYYRFGEVTTMHGQPPGFDRVRHQQVGVPNIELKHFEEAFTSEHWMVRIYKVREPFNRGSINSQSPAVKPADPPTKHTPQSSRKGRQGKSALVASLRARKHNERRAAALGAVDEAARKARIAAKLKKRKAGSKKKK